MLKFGWRQTDDYPLGAWQRLERTRPDWSHVRLDDIGHVPQLEAPQRYAHHLASWLSERWPVERSRA